MLKDIGDFKAANLEEKKRIENNMRDQEFTILHHSSLSPIWAILEHSFDGVVSGVEKSLSEQLFFFQYNAMFKARVLKFCFIQKEIQNRFKE